MQSMVDTLSRLEVAIEHSNWAQSECSLATSKLDLVSTEGHALAYLKYVTIDPLETFTDCDGIISGLGVTNWMVCLCKSL